MERRSKTQPEVIDDNSYFLQPGYIYFTKESANIRTVLGSCVAVCLWDKTRKMGGMNHFLYPRTKERATATAKFGNVAVIALIRMMDEAGCCRENIEAQIFGGADRYERKNTKDKTVGAANVNVARKLLSHKGISIVSEDVGGCMGRKVIFDTGTGEAAVFKVKQIREDDWLVH